jgi:hypothetical protein
LEEEAIPAPDTVHVNSQCPDCGDLKVFVLDATKYRAWREGALIQNVFPEIPYQDRERLISGTCAACWEAMFAGEDDE